MARYLTSDTLREAVDRLGASFGQPVVADYLIFRRSVSAWKDQDLANVAALRALRFTAPATLDDCIEAYKYAHAMKWSSRPRVDFMLHSERGVKMRVELGNAFVEATFDAE